MDARSDKQHYGLALSIAKELVQLHGGTIHVSDTDSICMSGCIKLSGRIVAVPRIFGKRFPFMPFSSAALPHC